MKRPPRLAERLLAVWETSPGSGPYDRSTVSPANFLDWREQGTDVFADLIAVDGWDASLRGGDVPERVLGYKVSPGFFPALGVPMVAAPVPALELITAQPRGFRWHLHPRSSRVSDPDWLRWAYLHMDHHLRQFGA